MLTVEVASVESEQKMSGAAERNHDLLEPVKTDEGKLESTSHAVFDSTRFKAKANSFELQATDHLRTV